MRHLHSGIFLFVQNAPTTWYSKRQHTVKAATFGSEFVKLRICKELIVALRYKLRRWFGVLIDGPATNVSCDNRGVVRNASIPESTMIMKHNAINYHSACKTAAAGILHVDKEDKQDKKQARWEMREKSPKRP
jgi:hypothetical protein